MGSAKIFTAAFFSRNAHKGQIRKYSNKPYFCHPSKVAGRMAGHLLATENLVAAAFLHDVAENTEKTLEEISEKFGEEVSSICADMYNPSKEYPSLPRHERKKMDREWLSRKSKEVKVLKMLDRIDNLESIAEDLALGYDVSIDWIKTYLEETTELSSAIGDADQELKNEMENLIVGLRSRVIEFSHQRNEEK